MGVHASERTRFAFGTPKPRLWLDRALIFCLISGSTAALLLCPCDCVTVHNHYAISLVALALLFAAAATVCVQRHVARDSDMTGFLRAVIAAALVGVSIYVELFLAMEIIAWLARPR